MTRNHDIVFIVLDSARKDRVSTYGHNRETTPALDEFASTATVYQNAVTPTPWTLPSHCSMFTGRFPTEHGITNGFTDRTLALPSDIPTIAEVLTDAGYATGGFSNNPWVGQLASLTRGFDRYVEWDLEVSEDNGSPGLRFRDEVYSSLHSILGRAAGQPHAVLKRRFFTANLIGHVKRWITHTTDRPSFTFLNLMEAHSPYYPPKQAFRELSLESPGRIEPRVLNTRLLAYVMGKTDLSENQRRRILDFYDASLRYQDRKLSELIAVLHDESLFDDALVVICADHGKTLGEYDRHVTPPHYLRDINVNVPLLIKWPGQRERRRVDAPVELVDLFTAVTNPSDNAALPTHEEGALVEDFIPHTARETTDIERWRALVDRRHKFVRNDEGAVYFFDREGKESIVDSDATDHQEYRERLDARINALDTSSRAPQEAIEGALDDTIEGQLQDLGYLQ